MEYVNACNLPMNLGSDLESLPIFNTPDKIVVRAYAALIGELLYIAINTVPQLRLLHDQSYPLHVQGDAGTSHLR